MWLRVVCAQGSVYLGGHQGRRVPVRPGEGWSGDLQRPVGGCAGSRPSRPVQVSQESPHFEVRLETCVLGVQGSEDEDPRPGAAVSWEAPDAHGLPWAPHASPGDSWHSSDPSSQGFLPGPWPWNKPREDTAVRQAAPLLAPCTLVLTACAGAWLRAPSAGRGTAGAAFQGLPRMGPVTRCRGSVRPDCPGGQSPSRGGRAGPLVGAVATSTEGPSPWSRLPLHPTHREVGKPAGFFGRTVGLRAGTVRWEQSPPPCLLPQGCHHHPAPHLSFSWVPRC